MALIPEKINKSVADLMASLYGAPKAQAAEVPTPRYTAPMSTYPVKQPGMSVLPVGPGFGMSRLPTAPATTTPPVVKQTPPVSPIAPVQAVTTPPPVVPAAPVVPPVYTRTPSAQDILDEGYIAPTVMAEPDPAAIYAQQLKMVQEQIDATNKIYNDQLVASRNRLAPIQKARTDQGFINNVRSGTIGSGFDTGVNEKITAANLDETAAAEAEIEDRRAQALAAINKVARESAATELAYQREQKSKNADAIIDEIKTRPERKKTALNPVILDMLKQGVDPSKMTPESLAELAKSFGKLNVSAADIKSAYETASAAQTVAETKASKEEADLEKTKQETEKLKAEIKAGKWITIGDGSMIYNPDTGKTIENPETFAPKDETKDKIYDKKTIPVALKSELLDDIRINFDKSARKESGAKKKSVQEFIAAYPEIDVDYITELYSSYN